LRQTELKGWNGVFVRSACAELLPHCVTNHADCFRHCSSPLAGIPLVTPEKNMTENPVMSEYATSSTLTETDKSGRTNTLLFGFADNGERLHRCTASAAFDPDVKPAAAT
jgi:hypothetical protein